MSRLVSKLKIQNLSNPKSNEFNNKVRQIVGKSFNDTELESLISAKDNELKEQLSSHFHEPRHERLNVLHEQHANEIAQRIFLQTIDLNWKSHIQYLEQLRQVIGLRSYGQRDPLVEYKKEAFVLFGNLLEKLKTDLITFLINLKIVDSSDENDNFSKKQQGKFNELSNKKIGRNEPCPCNSGKKYKHCHGAL